MEEIELTDQQFDYIKKLIADDIQRRIADKDHEGTFSRADLLLIIIKIHARKKSRNQSTGQHSTKETGRVSTIERGQPSTENAISVPLKRCTKCKEEKPIDRFSKHPRTRDRRSPVCKDCRKIYYLEHTKQTTKREKRG